MNRYSIFMIFSLYLCLSTCMAQDTLYFKNGNVAIGNIVDIDSARGKVAILQEESTRVLLFSILNRIGFDSRNHLNSDFFITQKVELMEAPKTEITTRSPLLGETKYVYNDWLVQFDLFSPWKKETLNYPYNSNVGIGIEYFFSERFSISVLGRFGTSNQTYSLDTIDTNFNSVYYDEEMDHEFEISTRFYAYGQRKFTPYFAPSISFGKYIYYHRKDFVRSYELEQDYYYSSAVLFDRRTDNYFEWGGAAGILMNLTRNINLSTQLILVSSNTSRSAGEYYEDNTSGGAYELYYIYDDRYRYSFLRFQVFLVCRFGGKLK